MNLKKFILLSGILTFIFLYTNSSFAQNSLQNFASIRVDELSDTQVRQFISQIQAKGVSDSQLEQAALSGGMKPEEIAKLRARVNRIKQNDQKKLSGNIKFDTSDTVKADQDSLTVAQKALDSFRSKIFGVDLFSSSSTVFEPNLRLATPQNYQVGPDDELLIDIYGYSEASYTLKVRPDGTINVPFVGILQVGGMTIEQATSRVSSSLTKIYPEIRTGNTKVRIAIGNIRSINVILTGEIVRPGTYTLPSVSSVFNALYQSGGPNQNGSFREIQLIRGGRRIETIDIYEFLLNGQFKNNIRLQDNDVILVPAYRRRIEVVGEVKRPGIYETINKETLADLLRFASGFTERAYQARIKVLKNTTIERKITDILSENFNTYEPSGGDKIFVDEILDRFENQVIIEGAVFRPGQYELERGLSLRQLIKKAEGLREDAFQNRGYITRLKDNLQTEIISFNVELVLSGSVPDIALRREDKITISSIFDLKEEYYIRVEGEVRRTGKLIYAEGMTLEDAILLAGGLKESAADQRIEVSRRVKNSNALSASAQIAEVFQLSAQQDLKSATSGFILKPFDIVEVRPSASYQVQRLVRIEGEVLYPGTYTITKKDERISDLIKRAGGFTAQSFVKGASLLRPGPTDESLLTKSKTDIYVLQKVRNKLDSISESSNKPTSLSDTIVVNSENSNKSIRKNENVGIDLTRIIAKPGSRYDLFLQDGDILNIPRQLQTIKVDGEVLSPSTVIHTKGRNFKHYIASAGGFSESAKRRRSYIKYSNGTVKTAKKILLFNLYPSPEPGAEIFVPKGAPRRAITITEIVGISTSILTMLLLFNQLK